MLQQLKCTVPESCAEHPVTRFSPLSLWSCVPAPPLFSAPHSCLFLHSSLKALWQTVCLCRALATHLLTHQSPISVGRSIWADTSWLLVTVCREAPLLAVSGLRCVTAEDSDTSLACVQLNADVHQHYIKTHCNRTAHKGSQKYSKFCERRFNKSFIPRQASQWVVSDWCQGCKRKQRSTSESHSDLNSENSFIFLSYRTKQLSFHTDQHTPLWIPLTWTKQSASCCLGC